MLTVKSVNHLGFNLNNILVEQSSRVNIIYLLLTI